MHLVHKRSHPGPPSLSVYMRGLGRVNGTTAGLGNPRMASPFSKSSHSALDSWSDRVRCSLPVHAVKTLAPPMSSSVLRLSTLRVCMRPLFGLPCCIVAVPSLSTLVTWLPSSLCWGFPSLCWGFPSLCRGFPSLCRACASLCWAHRFVFDMALLLSSAPQGLFLVYASPWYWSRHCWRSTRCRGCRWRYRP